MSNIEGTPAPEPTPIVPNITVNTPAPDPVADELAKWKALAKQNEAKAKANAQAATELEKLRATSMTEQERAVQTARDEATVEARKGFGARLVSAELKAAAAGRPAAVIDGLLEGIDATRFLDNDGEPNMKAIQEWVEKVAPLPVEPDSKALPFPDLGQGVRGATPQGAAQEFATFLNRQMNQA